MKKRFQLFQPTDIGLAKCTIGDNQVQSFEGIIIPKKTVSEISKIAEDFDEKVLLKFFKNQNKIYLW